MSFVVSLASDLLSVDAGSTTPLGVDIINRGEEPDVFEITVEGLDEDWYSLPVASISIEASGSAQDKILMHPPRASDSIAGNYPFVLRTRSLNSGDNRVVQGILEVRPFHQLSLDVEPRKIITAGVGAVAQFTLKVLNLSNTEHTLQVFASEPDAGCTFQFEHDRITLGPGQEREVLIDAIPTKRSIIANPRLYGLSFSVRSAAFPTVAAYANAQLEQRPLVSPIPALSVLGVAVLAFAWWKAMPRAPRIETFTVDKKEVVAGESITYVWRVDGARKVTITTSDQQVKTSMQDKGEGSLVFSAPGKYTITLLAQSYDESSQETAHINVLPRAVVNPPEIVSFSANPSTVFAGDAVTLQYEFNDTVKKAKILPIGYELDLTKRSLKFNPNWTGSQTLTLIVENSEGVEARKEVSIKVDTKCLASIATFDVSPKSIKASDGKVQISWRLVSAARAQLKVAGVTTDIDPVGGSQEVLLTKTSTITIIATDTNGKTVEKAFKVEVVPDTNESEDNGPDTTPPPATSPPPTNP